MTTEQSLQNREATALRSNPEIRRSARSLLAGKWNQCALASLVYFLVIGAASGLPRIGNLAGFVIGGPMAFGVALFFLRLSRGQEFDLRHLFAGVERRMCRLVSVPARTTPLCESSRLWIT